MSRLLMLLALPALLAGCAAGHPIEIAPPYSTLDVADGTPLDQDVGYFISPGDRARLFTTPGGGGEKVSYRPYEDLEPTLVKVLSSVFRRVHALDAPNDVAALRALGIAYVFIPEIRTNSSSGSTRDWPPTRFRLELDCRALDRGGKVAWDGHVVALGEASALELKGLTEAPLAGRRASLEALVQLQRELRASTALWRRTAASERTEAAQLR
jgi:hypothetical protein